MTAKVHALTDAVGRPCALMLTPGNVADVTTAPMLPRKAGRMRQLIADKGCDAGNPREGLRQGGTVPASPDAATARRPSPATRRTTADATSSRTPSAPSRASAASPPAATSPPTTSSPP